MLTLALILNAPLAVAGQFAPNVFPKELFVKESSPVIFTVKPDQANDRLTLIEVDEKGKKLRYIGVMTDDGVMGDKIRGDGVYTRKISVTEKKAQLFHYAVVEETDAGVPDELDPAKTSELRILGRPSMVEVLSSIWARIRNAPSQNL